MLLSLFRLNTTKFTVRQQQRILLPKCKLDLENGYATATQTLPTVRSLRTVPAHSSNGTTPYPDTNSPKRWGLPLATSILLPAPLPNHPRLMTPALNSHDPEGYPPPGRQSHRQGFSPGSPVSSPPSSVNGFSQ